MRIPPVTFLSLFLTGLPVAAQTLTVEVCNFSRADHKMLTQAEAVARKAFQNAGLETVWLTADDPTHPGKVGPARLRVQVYPGQSKRSDIKDAFGVAMTLADQTASSLADVFFGNIEEVATTRTDETVFLGYVMAHEVGHLLGMGHAPDTIMADGWNARDIRRMEAGHVQFTRTQAERLRAAVALRMAKIRQ